MKRYIITFVVVFVALFALAFVGADPIRMAAAVKGEKLVTAKTA